MRRTARMTVPALFMVLVALLAAGDCGAQLTGGKSAPVFTLKGLDGKTYDLAQAKDRPMVVLYFFDVDSRPSQEGLLTLNDLAKRHGEQDLSVWAVTSSPREKVSAFRASSGLTFPILLDGGEVGTLYPARLVLPTVAVIGPGLKILNYYQGGGKTTEVMLTGLAERQLQRRLTKYAQAVSDAVLKADPKSPKPRRPSMAMRRLRTEPSTIRMRVLTRRSARSDRARPFPAPAISAPTSSSCPKRRRWTIITRPTSTRRHSPRNMQNGWRRRCCPGSTTIRPS